MAETEEWRIAVAKDGAKRAEGAVEHELDLDVVRGRTCNWLCSAAVRPWAADGKRKTAEA